ncbi:MAG: 5-deoxy-glucuronate isomerase [Candidatus Parvarchaeota archaeon]
MLHYKNESDLKIGYREVIGKGQQMNFLRLSILQLNEDFREYSGQTGEEECAIVPLYGNVKVTCGSNEVGVVGGRDSVFSKPADLAYIPTHSRYSVAISDNSQSAKLLVCRTVAERHFDPFIVRGSEAEVVQRGRGQWTRIVRNILVDKYEGKVDRLILGETINSPGQWSGYPPHRHVYDNPPYELPFEEIYYYEFQPKDGFGVQVHYGSKYGEDRGYLIRSGDAFAIPDGYHPVVAAGGYSLYYLWFMAGPKGRKLLPYLDPDHTAVEKL